MSTKFSLMYERDEATRQQVHLYTEAFDEDHVYLAVEGFAFEAASSMNLSGEWGPRMAFKLPNQWALKLGLIGSITDVHGPVSDTVDEE